MKYLALLVVLILVGFATANASPLVFVVRHAEKGAGDQKDPDLSAAGEKRAQALARMLKDAAITAVFTTEFKRTQETAAPTAKETQLIPTVVPANDLPSVVAKIRVLSGNALVVGHGNTIPDLVKALGIQTAVSIPDNDYTEIFVIILGEKPELVRLHYSF